MIMGWIIVVEWHEWQWWVEVSSGVMVVVVMSEG